MKDVLALSVENLGKRFKIYSNPWNRMKEWLAFGRRSYHREFWAVQKVTLNVHKGEFLGIIGPNGAGKSTLLKMITGVLIPTTGTYKINGRILSLLELGSGLDMDLTGRENVKRSAQLLELPQGYVEERMDQIRDFSELGDFFDRPMNMYSTGMRTRLSFSMFAFIDCDVLILDEVLAVGDIFFKQKCFSRLDELIQKETAIILVTHSMGIIQRYCDRVVLLNEGQVILDGAPIDAIRKFTQLRGRAQAIAVADVVSQELLESGISHEEVAKYAAEFTDNQNGQSFWPPANVFQSSSAAGAGAVLTRFAVLDDKGNPSMVFKQGETMRLYFEFRLLRPIELPVAQVEIRDERNLLIHSRRSFQEDLKLPRSLPEGYLVRIHYNLRLDLAPQGYLFNLDLFTISPDKLDELAGQSYAESVRKLNRLCRADRFLAIHVMPQDDAKLEELYGGLVSLAGEFKFEATQDT